MELDTDRGGATGIKIGRYSLKGKAGKKGGQGAAQLTVRYICCAVALRCASFARRMQDQHAPLLYFFELPWPLLTHAACTFPCVPLSYVYDASLQRDHDAEAEEEEGDGGRASFRDGLRWRASRSTRWPRRSRLWRSCRSLRRQESRCGWRLGVS